MRREGGGEGEGEGEERERERRERDMYMYIHVLDNINFTSLCSFQLLQNGRGICRRANIKDSMCPIPIPHVPLTLVMISHSHSTDIHDTESG